MVLQRQFQTLDFVVFIGTIVISFSIGLFYAILDRRRNTPLDYFLAGRRSHVIPVALSFVVSFQSSLIVLGLPGDVYMYGMLVCYTSIGIAASYIFAGLIVVPVFHELNITSVYKYFEMRYHGNAIRYLAMTAGVMYTLFYMGSVTYASCLALQVVIGIPFWATIILYTTVTAIYTAIGGIKAVIWSDVFQVTMMMTGITAVIIKSTMNAGGIANVWKVAENRLDMNDFRLDPTIRYQFWSASIGAFTQFLFLCFSQAGIQRINSTPTIKAGRLVFVLSAPVYAILLLFAAFQGVTVFAYYAASGCDPLESGQLININELIPRAVMDLFHDLPGLAGLFIAALSSAALSTLSSCLSSLSAITYEDILKVKYPHIEEHKATNISKLFVIVYGVIALAMSIFISQIPGPVTAVFAGFMGCIDGPTCAIFLISMMFRRATTKGVFVGFICGMVITFWLIMGKTFYPIPPYPMLPPGPVDQCIDPGNVTLSNLTISETAVNEYSLKNITNLYMQNNLSKTTTSAYETNEDHELSILETLYSISYMLLSFMGFVISVVIGVIVSLLTTPPEKIDERCMFSFRRHVWDGCPCWKSKPVKEENGDAARIEEETQDLMTSKI